MPSLTYNNTIDVAFPDLERPQAQQNFLVLRRYFILVTFNVPILTQATNHNILFYCDWINGSSRYKSKVLLLHPPTEINLKVHLPSFANVSINFHLFSLCPKMFPACSASHQAKFRGLARSHLFVCFCAFLFLPYI